MSEFLNIYTAVQTKDIKNIKRNGLSPSTISDDNIDYIVFTNDYSEMISLKEKYGYDISILSFHTKYLNELNKEYNLCKLDENHYYTVERIDPKYILIENNYFLFSSLNLWNTSGLNESMITERYIFEKYGVTENLDPILNHIVDTITNVYVYPINRACYDYVNITNLYNPNGVQYEFKMDKLPQTINWFNFEDSSLILSIRKYKDKAEYLNILNNDKSVKSQIYSEINIEKSIETDLITGNIICNINEYSDGYYLGIHKFTDFYELIPWLRHEFNHLHKDVYSFVKRDIDLKNNVENKDSSNLTKDELIGLSKAEKRYKKDVIYGNVIRLKNSIFENDYLKKIAEILYMYCNDDERNANIEQYFEEHRMNPGNELSRLTLNELRNFIIDFIPTYEEKVTIYAKFRMMIENRNIEFNAMKRHIDKNDFFFDFLKHMLIFYIEKTEKGFERVDKYEFPKRKIIHVGP